MKQYKRPKQKQLNLTRINEYTILGSDENAVSSCRSHTDKALRHNQKDDGRGGNQSGGSGKKDWGRKNQHQQIDEGKRYGEHRLSIKDCGEHQYGCGAESPQKIGEAA